MSAPRTALEIDTDAALRAGLRRAFMPEIDTMLALFPDYQPRLADAMAAMIHRDYRAKAPPAPRGAPVTICGQTFPSSASAAKRLRVSEAEIADWIARPDETWGEAEKAVGAWIKRGSAVTRVEEIADEVGALLKQGHTRAEVARRMGVSRNSIIKAIGIAESRGKL